MNKIETDVDASFSVIGTWAMVEAWDIGDDPADSQKKPYPWGNPSAGYWVYDKSAHFSLMISQNRPLVIPTDLFFRQSAACLA